MDKNKANWVNSKNVIDIVLPIVEVKTNPYYTKWKRGRPTKDMIKQRELWQKWEIDNNDYFKLIFSIKDTKPSYKHEEKSFFKKKQ